MKIVQITIGDYDLSKLEEIFEKEDNFQPTCPEDQIIIEIMRQCIDPDNVVEDDPPETSE